MKPGIARAILGGFTGTVVMTLAMYFVAPVMMGMPMDVAGMMAPMLGGSWMMGMLVHFINGTLIFPVVYVYIYQWLPGGPSARGITLGAILWLLSQTVVSPMMGGGFFSAAMGGVMASMGSLIFHIIYGWLLGAVAGAPTPAWAGTAR